MGENGCEGRKYQNYSVRDNIDGKGGGREIERKRENTANVGTS